MKPNKKILKIHPLDNLIVALSDLNKGEIFNIGNKKIKLKTDVKAKHKFAIDNLNFGSQLYLYGVVVGKAIKSISEGEAVNTQNIRHHTKRYSLPKNLKKHLHPIYLIINITLKPLMVIIERMAK